MGGYAGNAGVFLIQTLFGLYILAVMLRLILQVARADFYNPVSQFLVKVTNPPLVPMRRVIPGVMGIDVAAVVLMLILKTIEIFLITLMSGVSLSIMGLFVFAIADLLELLLNVFFFTILIQVIMSWVNPGGHNPAIALLYGINEPLLSRARRMIPPISGFDLSPIVVMIALQLLSILLIAPIKDLARVVAGT
jgi:YggT family protein